MPEDLEVATPRLLADLLLDGLVAIKTRLLANALSRPAATIAVQPPTIPATEKGNLLVALNWALAKRSGKTSEE